MVFFFLVPTIVAIFDKRYFLFHFSPTDLPFIQKIYPNSRLEFIDAGHLLHMEKPAEFLQLVLDFVNE